MKDKGKVLLGMSGGKDSTWACRVLQEEGYEVEGMVLSLHSNAPVEKARLSAEKLGIKLHVSDYSEEFKREVEDNFVSVYVSGKTPNPCVECNKKIKFACLIKEADRLGIEKIATGHYVKVEKGKNGRITMRLAKDTKKDQTYFLWQLDQNTLSRLVTPLADTTKEEIVKNVTEANLMDKVEESQEICFIPDDDYVSYLKERLGKEKADRVFVSGNFVNQKGEVLGKHQGYPTYTVGQRKGLGIALGRPAYVLGINAEKNEVVLGYEEDNRTCDFKVKSLNFVSIDEFEGEMDCFVRPRYRSPLIPVTVKVEKGEATVHTHTPTKLVSPGQSAVFYDKEGRVLFGGYIL